MKCETCRHVTTELALLSQCRGCDGYNRYEPDRDAEEKLDHNESIANDHWRENMHLNGENKT